MPTVYGSIISRNVPDEGGRRDPWRHATALGIEMAILPDTTHVTLMNRMTTDRPDGERLSRYQPSKH